MKRKDWKKKNLKEDFFGKLNKNFTKSFYFSERRFFLRKLSLRKHNVLLNKNLKPIFFYYRYLLKDLVFKKKSNIYKIFILLNTNKIKISNSFSFKKNIFGDILKFRKLKKGLKFRYLRTDLNSNFGSPTYILNIKDHTDLEKSLLIEENKNIFFLKNLEFSEKNNFNINYFLDFNIHMLNCLEIYKIIIYLNINNLNK